MNKELYTQNANRIKPFLSDYVSEITKPTKVKNQYICPLCNSGAGKNGTGAFTIYPETNSYYCYACGRGGDIFSLYSAVNHTDFKEAAERLSEKYNRNFNDLKPAQSFHQQQTEQVQKDYTKLFQYAETRLTETDYLNKRGIPAEIQKRFKCGYIPDFNYGNNQKIPAIIIPTSNYSFICRSTTGNIKQKRGKSHILNSSALTAPYCFVVEGEIDCMSVYSCSHNFPCIATGSTSNIRKIFDYNVKNTVLIIAMDNDEAGRQASKELEELCIEHETPFITASDIWNDCKDANELLVKDCTRLTENLKKYATQAKNFDRVAFKHKQQIKEKISIEQVKAKTAEPAPEQWEKPLSFDKPEKLSEFPLYALPELLQEYLHAVCEFVQVPHEMAVLPLLSVLATAVQGKALVKHPFNSHTQPLNLYTITAAVPGERKSGTLTEFLKPLIEYQNEYNEKHAPDIEKYKTERAFLEKQRNNAINGKKPDLQRAKDIAGQIARLTPVYEMILNVSDVTPEALAFELSCQSEKMGILDHESGIFDILSGLYSGRKPNIDIFLKGYDGDPYSVLRRGTGNILLKNPLLTIGIMTQPEKLATAVKNKEFMGRGLMHRFLFAFPEKQERINISSPDIPEDLAKLYRNVVKILLDRQKSNSAVVMQFEENTKDLFESYHSHIQQLKRDAECNPDFQEWLSKHFSRALRIAGVLHLFNSSPNEKINALTVQRAIKIAEWAESYARKALCECISESQEDVNAKYVLEKIKSSKAVELSKTEIVRKCRKLNNAECAEALTMLADMNYIHIKIAKTGGRSKELINLNPEIAEKHV